MGMRLLFARSGTLRKPFFNCPTQYQASGFETCPKNFRDRSAFG